MRTHIFLLFISISFFSYTQTTYTYTGSGDWDEQANWSPSYPGTTIQAEDEVIVSEGSTLSILFITNNGKFTNKGITESRSSFNNNGMFINENTFGQRSTFNNNGTLINKNTFNSDSTFNNFGLLTNNGDWNNNSFFVNNSELQNNGTLIHRSFMFGENSSHTGDFELNSLFSPGNSTSPSIGRYLFNENLNCSSSALITMHVLSISEIDLIEVTNRARLSGSLTVNLLEDYDPEIGSTYTILTAKSIRGRFTRVNLPDLAIGKELRIVYNVDSVVLEVIDSTLSTNNSALFQKIKLYPNPSSHVLHIDGLIDSKKIAIYSYLGSKLSERIIGPGNNEILLSSLSKGAYFLVIDNYYYRFVKN